MRIEYEFIGQNSILLTIANDYRILLECPLEISREPLDWPQIDLILVSNFQSGLDLINVTEYTDFNGRIYMTIPTREFLHLHMSEVVDSNQDMVDCFQKFEGIYHNHPQLVFADLKITSLATGTGLGTSNWLIEYGSSRIVYSVGWTKPPISYVKPMQVTELLAADVFIANQLMPPCKTKDFIGKDLKELWPSIYEIIKSKGTIIIPCSVGDHLFEMIYFLYNLMDSDSLKHIPLHVVSKGLANSLALSDIYCEWLAKDRQSKAINAMHPFLHGELLESKRILCHTGVDELLRFPGPRIVFAPSIDHISSKTFEILEKSNVYDHYLLLVPDTIRISGKQLTTLYPNLKTLCYTHENGYSTLKQLEQLLLQINPAHVISRDMSNPDVQPRDVIEVQNVYLEYVLPQDTLNLNIEGQAIDLTGSKIVNSRKYDPLVIDIKCLLGKM